jgi:predicted RNase H-related nuclease YkuK (DUF458 family)
MIRYFKKIDGTVVTIDDHTHNILKVYPNCTIHVGTDSQNSKKNTTFCTVVAYRLGTRGVHYVYSIKREPRIRDLWSRLYKEAEYSIEVAQLLDQHLNVKLQIDMDYNNDIGRKSNNVITAAKGWASSLGYKVNVKPDELIATKAADYHCRK